MKQQAVRVFDALHVDELDVRVGYGIEGFIHVLQHLFYPNLLGIAYRPHRVKLQPFHHSRFKDKYGSSTRAGYEVDALCMEVGNG